MDRREFLVHARLDRAALEAFLEAGWLVPRRAGGAHHFSEIDIVRARLIRDLQHDLGVNDDGVSIILDLIDQMHGLRRTLRQLMAAVGAQPVGTRARILAEIRTVASARPVTRPVRKAPRRKHVTKGR
jgi:chaperone modulatory protein CbpM